MNFGFYMPVRVVSGRNCLAEQRRRCAETGGFLRMVVTGEALGKNQRRHWTT